jgi:hypothetical protein
MRTGVQMLAGSLALAFVIPTFAGVPAKSRIEELRDADQADRAGDYDSINWSVVAPRDATRRVEVRKLLADGRLRTSSDYLAAALIFQHGEGAEEMRVAHSLATIAYELDPENRNAGVLMAASWDRLMMRLKRPQWYATQFVRNGDKWVLYDIDESIVTDEERKRIGGRTLAEARALADSMNANKAGAP